MIHTAPLPLVSRVLKQAISATIHNQIGNHQWLSRIMAMAPRRPFSRKGECVVQRKHSFASNGKRVRYLSTKLVDADPYLLAFFVYDTRCARKRRLAVDKSERAPPSSDLPVMTTSYTHEDESGSQQPPRKYG